MRLGGYPRCSVNRRAVGIAFGIGYVTAVEADPNRNRPCLIGGVAFFNSALDRHGGLDGPAGRREQGHEAVPEPLDVGATACLDL